MFPSFQRTGRLASIGTTRVALKGALLASAAGLVLVVQPVGTAWAADGDGGKGGNVNGAPGGAGGTTGPGNPGATGPGSSPGFGSGGGGGGGAGLTGGDGGKGGSSSGNGTGTDAGAGGSTTVPSGGNGTGTAFNSTSAGGGGGGAHGFVGSVDTIPTVVVTGGNGGNGGNATGSSGASGGGGGGGFGGVVTGIAGGTTNLAVTMTAGSGGAGGVGGNFSGSGGGGSGGSGLVLLGITSDNQIAITAGTHIAGGDGGNGGSAGMNSRGGDAGNGGAGLVVDLSNGTNALRTADGAEMKGGAGGTGGMAGLTNGIGGTGGAGLAVTGRSAAATTVIVEGTLQGGSGGTGARVGADGAGLFVNNATVILRGGASVSGGGTNGPSISFGAGTNVLELQAAPGGSLATLVGNMSGAGADDNLRLAGSNDASFDVSGLSAGGTYGSFGTVEKTTAATWTLTGTTNSTAAWDIEAGTLALSNPASIATAGQVIVNSVLDVSAATGASNINNLTGTSATAQILLGGQGLTIGGSARTSFAGSVSGDGTLTKSGAGTLTLTNANEDFTGATVIGAGTLALSDSGSLAASSGVKVNGTLDISRTTSGATIANLSGTSGAGSLVIGSRTLTVDQKTDEAFSGSVAGNGGFVKTGAGALALSGNLTGFAGTATVDKGTLAISGLASLNAASNVVVNDGTLDFSESINAAYVRNLSGGAATGTVVIGERGLQLFQNSDASYAGSFSGESSLEKMGNGTFTLTNANDDYTGGVLLDGGTLALKDDGNLAAASSVTANSGTLDISGTRDGTTIHDLHGKSGNARIALGEKTLTVAQNDSLSFAGQFSGTGTLAVEGDSSGGLTLTGDSSAFAGKTDVRGGTLQLSAADSTSGASVLGGDVVVRSGGAIRGDNGTVTGELHVNAGGTLLGTNLDGGLNMGSLVLDAGAVTQVTLAGANPSQAIFTAAGSMILDGTLDVQGAPGYGIGVYRIFSAGTTLTDNGLTIGQAPTGNFGTSLDVGATTVDLVVEAPDTSLQYWSADGTNHGGSGVWDASHSWSNKAPGTSSPWDSQTGVFTGQAGTVTVAGAQTFGTLEFVTDGYTLVGGNEGALDLGDGGRLWAEGADTTATVSASITGTGALTKIGAGTIVLKGANSYAGGTTITGGTLSIDNDANLGAASGGIVLAGGKLRATDSFTSARDIALAADQGMIDVAQGKTLTLGGVISGEGALVKDDLGMLILTGDNNYAGGTIIKAGTLQIGNGGDTGSILGDLVNDGTLIFDRTGTYRFPGSITGSGEVQIRGGGSVQFSGAGGYTGPISLVGAGMVLDQGSTTRSSFSVGEDAMLSGTGTIGGLIVHQGGTAAPGYSPGTLNVDGNVLFEAGSVYRVDVTPLGEHDLIAATGTATLQGGTVEMIAEAGVYAPNTTRTILTADASVTGTFASVTSNLPFLTPTLSYGANEVRLTFARNDIAFATMAVTANQRGPARSAEALGMGNALYDAIVKLTDDTAPAAFDSLSGEVHASANAVLLDQSAMLRQATGMRLSQALSTLGDAGTSGMSETAYGATASAWGYGFGSWGDIDGDGNAAHVSHDVGGFIGGVDATIGETGRVGVLGGYGRSTFRTDRTSSGKSDSYHVGVYGGVALGQLGLKAAISHSWHDLTVDRTVAFSNVLSQERARYDAATTQVFGEIAWSARLGTAAVEPYAGLAYVDLPAHNVQEKGGTAALVGKVDGQEALFSTLGLRATTSFVLNKHTMLKPYVSAGWQHGFGDLGATAMLTFAGTTAPVFSVNGIPLAADSALIGAGLDFNMGDRVQLSIGYTGTDGGSTRNNTARGALSIRF